MKRKDAFNLRSLFRPFRTFYRRLFQSRKSLSRIGQEYCLDSQEPNQKGFDRRERNIPR